MAGAPWAEATGRGLHEGFFLKGSTLLSSVELEGNEILLPLRYKTSHDATDVWKPPEAFLWWFIQTFIEAPTSSLSRLWRSSDLPLSFVKGFWLTGGWGAIDDDPKYSLLPVTLKCSLKKQLMQSVLLGGEWAMSWEKHLVWENPSKRWQLANIFQWHSSWDVAAGFQPPNCYRLPGTAFAQCLSLGKISAQVFSGSPASSLLILPCTDDVVSSGLTLN